jgi:hypothetical protein
VDEPEEEGERHAGDDEEGERHEQTRFGCDPMFRS